MIEMEKVNMKQLANSVLMCKLNKAGKNICLKIQRLKYNL